MRNKKHFQLCSWLISFFVVLLPMILIPPINTKTTTKQDSVTQLPNEDTKQKQVQYVKSLDDIEYEFVIGEDSTSHFAIVDGGFLFGWGGNGSGQLGLGHKDPVNNPINIVFPGAVTHVAVGTYNTIVVVDYTDVYITGSNVWGQHGNGQSGNTGTDKFVPNQRIRDMYEDDYEIDSDWKIESVEIGSAQVLMVMRKGERDIKVFAWGDNQKGQCGVGSSGMGNYVLWPTQIGLPTDVYTYKIMAAGGVSTFVAYKTPLGPPNQIYIWGDNTKWFFNTTNDAISPKAIQNLPKGDLTNFSIMQNLENVDGAKVFTILFTVKNGNSTKLYGIGSNYYGQMGIGPEAAKQYLTPVELTSPLFNSNDIQNVYTGSSFTAVEVNHQLFLAGYNKYGVLCDGTFNDNSTYKPANYTNYNETTKYSVNMYAVLAVTDHVSSMWGRNWENVFGQDEVIEKAPNPVVTDTFTEISKLESKNNDPLQSPKSALLDFNPSGNIIDQVKLAKYVNGIDSFPAGNVMTVKNGTKPIVDDIKGTITISITASRSYAFPYGWKTERPLSHDIVIRGFKSATKTTFYSKTQTQYDLVVDKWLSLVSNADGTFKYNELEQYLTLNNVPKEAKLTKRNYSQDNVTGKISFEIQSDWTTDYNMSAVPLASDWFPITLNFTPRVTIMQQIESDYPNQITPTTLKEKLFNEQGMVISQSLFEQYAKIIAPVDNAKYNLVPNSWNEHTGDGTVSFKVYADKYYDTNAKLQTGSAENQASIIEMDLQLKALSSKLIVADSAFSHVRVDKFIDYVSNGIGIDLNRLSEFILIEHLPSAANLKIMNANIAPYDENYTRDQITFDLEISHFNNAQGIAEKYVEKNITLTLGVQHKETTMEVKPDYDASVRIDNFAQTILSLNSDMLLSYLNHYVDIESLPSDATLSVKNIILDEETGAVHLEIVASHYYDQYSELKNDKSFPLSFSFAPKHATTNITVNPNYPKNENVSVFAQKISQLKGIELYNYLVPIYVNAVNVINENNISVIIVNQINQEGKISVGITVDAYYDAHSELITENKTFTLNFDLTQKFPKTVIETLPPDVYPHDITPSAFEQHLKYEGAEVNDRTYTLNLKNLAFMKKFMQLESIPPNSTYKLTVKDHATSDASGFITFDFEVSQYYDAEHGKLNHEPLKAENLRLVLSKHTDISTEKSETVITVKDNAPYIKSSEEFLNEVLEDESVNYNKLSLYVSGLDTIPATASVNITISGTNVDSSTFALEMDKYYNEAGILVNIPKAFGFSLLLVPTTSTNKSADSGFPWWWILVGLGGVTIIGLIIWFGFKKYDGQRMTF